MNDAAAYVQALGKNARRAAGDLAAMRGEAKTAALLNIAAALRNSHAEILAANAKDVAEAQASGLAPPLIERLTLNEKRIASMVNGVIDIAHQNDPVGQTIEGHFRPNGLRVERRRVPIGVILFFYESRPNVTADAAALCIKSGNAVILRGGKEAFHSNRAIVQIIKGALTELPDAIQFVESTDRSLVPELLKLDKYIDLTIPRGGESLIRAVVEGATMPVLKHFTGNCHLYVDSSARDIEKQVREICVNAKTSYPGGAVCNAVEHLLFHTDVASMIPKVCEDLAAKGVEIRGAFQHSGIRSLEFT